MIEMERVIKNRDTAQDGIHLAKRDMWRKQEERKREAERNKEQREKEKPK